MTDERKDDDMPVGAARRVVAHRAPDGNFDVYLATENPDEQFFDGVAQVMTGPLVTRISFYQLVGIQPDEGGASVEQRLMKGHIAIPTVSMAQFCLQYLEGIRSNDRILTESANSLTAVVKDVVGKLK